MMGASFVSGILKEHQYSSLRKSSLSIFTGIPLLIILNINGLCQLKQPEQENKDFPNIVLILADDFGYGDLSCYGATKVSTPHVDKLASEGMRFTDAYVVSSLCSPSRYSILTGRYSWRTHLKTGVLQSFAPPLIEESRTTLASMLKRQGYHTACIGKWHLGFNWALKENAPSDADETVFKSWGTEPQEFIDFTKPVKGGPSERGFDYFFGISGSNNMIPFVIIENDKVTAPPSIPNNFGANILRAPNWDLRYLDQEFTNKAVEVIENHFSSNNENPLFLYFSTSAIHWPCLPTITKGKSQAGMRGDMVLKFDWMVGELIKSLEKHGAMENTLIIVTSDNGPQPGDPYLILERFRNKAFGGEFNYYQTYFGEYQPQFPGIGGQKNGWLTYGHDPTAGLLGFKSDAWEGGLRVPLILYWQGKIKGGTVNSSVVSTVDFLATIAEITDVELQENEGEDSYSFLQNLLDNNSPQARKSLTIIAGRSGAMVVRKGDWKYIEGASPQIGTNGQTYPPPPNEFSGSASIFEPQIYYLKEDTFERNNLHDRMPGKVTELKGVLESTKSKFKSEHK